MDDSYCEPKIDLPRWAEQCAAPGGVVRGRSEGDVTQKPEEGRGDTWVRPNLGQPGNQSLACTDAKPLWLGLQSLGNQRGIAETPGTLLLMSHPNRGFLAPKWVTHHFWEIHICGAAPLSINAILPICKGLVAARTTLCAVVNTYHPLFQRHIRKVA